MIVWAPVPVSVTLVTLSGTTYVAADVLTGGGLDALAAPYRSSGYGPVAIQVLVERRTKL